MSVESKESVDLTQVVQRAVNLPSIKASPEKPLHYAYLNDFRVEACPLFKQHQCQQHRPYTCFYWHFANQRRRRPLRRRDGTFNYSPDIYCTKYDENTGICPDGDECMYLHRVAGDVERKYHLRYYKTAACVHQTDGKGHCAKNGQHCAFAHSPDDVRHAVYDIRELQGRSETATFEGEDGRGRTTPTNKMSGETVNLIREHISKFPAVESHYCRASSRRLYLDSNLSLGKLYHLYCQFCNEQNPPTDPVSITSYKRIICNENNIGFHHPRKDQCARCAKFELATDKSEELQQEYESHRARAQAAQNSKRMSKEMAMNDKSIVTATFDLQSVLQLPYADISPFYYKRKLWVYNFTIFDGVSKEGYCFLWNEIDGKRGSDEIGSCLLDWLSSQPESCTNVRLFSDSCGGQNRNQFIAAALLYAAQKLQFHEITMSYLEPGHTQMEVDSMHSAIEREKKGERVFTMQEWEALLKRSRRGQEYRVRRMKHTDFKSLKKLAAEIINNRSVDEQGHTVNWMKIKALRFVKGEQTAIYYNYGYDEDSFKRIFVRKGKSTTYVSESNGVPNTNSAVGAQPTIFSADNKDRTSFVVEDPVWQDQEHVLSCYKTEPCRKPARLCRQGYACPYFHNAKDRRRPPAVIKYRSTPCPNAKQSDEWVEAECCDSLDQCQYCHSRTEQQFHPEIYKSTKCNDMLQHGYCPRGPFCAFAHNDNELHAERHLHVPSSDVKDTKRELQDDEKTQKELDRVNTDFGQVDLPEAPMAPASDTLISPSSIANRQSRRTNSSSSDMPIGSAPSYSSPPQLQSVLKHRTTSQSSGPTTVSAPMSMGQGQPSSIMSSSYPRAPGFERHQHSPPRTWTPDQGSGSHPITVTVGGTNRVRTQSLGQQVAAMDLGYTIGSSEALGTSPLSSSFGMRRDLMTCLEDGHSSGDELQLPPISERDESAVLGLCSLISNAVNGGGAAGGKTESGDGNMEFGSIGRLSTTSQRPIGQPMAIPGAQANHQMLQFSESSSGGGLNGSLPTASHLFGAINRAVSAGGGHGSGGSNTHLNMSGSFSNHESPLMPGSEPNQSTIAKMAGELDMNTLVAELQRTNIELNSHRAKVAAWEEGLKQARQACEAWKKEAEAYKTRASAAETERIQLREERDMAVNQVAYLRAELGRLQQEHIRVKDVQLPATFDQLLMQLTHQSQQQQQHQHQQPDVQRTIAGAPPLIPSSMTPSGPMCGRCGRTVGAGKGAGCSFCSNAFNAQAVKNV